MWIEIRQSQCTIWSFDLVRPGDWRKEKTKFELQVGMFMKGTASTTNLIIIKQRLIIAILVKSVVLCFVEYFNFAPLRNWVEQKVMGKTLLVFFIPRNRVTGRASFSLVHDKLNGLHCWNVVVYLKRVSVYRPVLDIDLSTAITRKYTVISATIG